jgi:hypothetical protein
MQKLAGKRLSAKPMEGGLLHSTFKKSFQSTGVLRESVRSRIENSSQYFFGALKCQCILFAVLDGLKPNSQFCLNDSGQAIFRTDD